MRERKQNHRDQDRDETQERASQGPDYIAYSVKDIGEDQSVWNRLGAAFTHKDGQGMDVLLDAMPVDGRVTLREQRREDFKKARSEERDQPSRTQSRDRQTR